MKVYSIPTPNVLRWVAVAIKHDRDHRKAMQLADDWERESWDGQQEVVTLEVGRNAHLYHFANGKKELLATMYVAPTRDFVKELDGYEDSALKGARENYGRQGKER